MRQYEYDFLFMNITEFKKLLIEHPDKLMRFQLPNGKSIPPHYHITEVGHVRKDFIDCGGTVRSASSCMLQAWVATNDEDHRLSAGKLGTILKLADKILPSSDLPMEIEYEAPIISQFSVTKAEMESDAIVFQLAYKRTDCLAKESCGLEGAPCGCEEETTTKSEEESCCGTSKSKCC